MRAGEPRAGRRAGLVDRLRRGDDEGRIALLALGFVVVAASLVLVVTAAAGVHLDRKRLLALADLAALDAADALSASAYYAGGLPSDGLPPRGLGIRTGGGGRGEGPIVGACRRSFS